MSRHVQVELLFSEYIRSLSPLKQELKHVGLGSRVTGLDSGSGIEQLRPLCQSVAPMPIAAVDASSNLIGYSYGYAYELLRAAMVIKRGNGKLRLTKLGPFIMKSSSERGSFMYELETMAQRMAAKKIRNGIVLFDGTALESMDSEFHIPDILRENNFISLSKTVPVQSLEEEGALPREPFVAKLRDEGTYLVRLSTNGFVLRSTTSTGDIESTTALFSSLISSDSFEMGYPRTMKLAHIYSKILPIDILSARLALYEKHSIKARDPIDGRKLLLGCLWG